MIKAKSTGSPISIGFLLVPNFSMLAFSSSIEPLRVANQLAGAALYNWTIVGASESAVTASNGIAVTPDTLLSEAADLDALFVCSGARVKDHATPEIIEWLRGAARRNIVLGGIGTGTYLLAKADTLSGCRSTIHWESMASSRSEFPHLVISSELFEIEKNRYTCAGGTAALDMFLHEIRSAHGTNLAAAITEQLLCERIRNKHDHQRIPLKHRIGTHQPKLAEAVLLMEANIEEPVSLDELAVHIGLSRRQMERSFKRYLQSVPKRYYLEVRLERARQLLLQTSMPIAEVAYACGFVSGPHFSRCYRNVFSIPPRDERRRTTGQACTSGTGKTLTADPGALPMQRNTIHSASAPSASESAHV